VNQIDDIAMMTEVVRRRFSDKRDFEALPDLLLVDGGKGHLNQVLAVLKELDLTDQVPVAGLAKEVRPAAKQGPGSGDRLYVPGRKNPLVIKNDPRLLFLLARLRDEAHRFALTYYQRRHRGNLLHSRLDQVSGIGVKRRRALLRRFGSVKRIAEASVEEIGQVPGISMKLAERIHATFRGD
jgi:excinuclease ABC subunit C